ncbi:MAG: DUF2382 domain-containing protein [Actinobacteria bacterium]|nr:DUF2382 domain-containing protein [Actinomycetota bacterium]
MSETILRAHKRVETEAVSESLPRAVEHAEVERIGANEGDSGEIETLPDGSISIPVLEEELVITRRVVVRERIVIRKETRTEHEVVRAELRKERVEIEGGNE